MIPKRLLIYCLVGGMKSCFVEHRETMDHLLLHCDLHMLCGAFVCA